MKNTVAVPTSQRMYEKIHDPNFLTEIYKLHGYDSTGGVPVGASRFDWTIISVFSWIPVLMFPNEELFLYAPKSLRSWYACIIFYAILATAGLSLTYAAYKFGEGVKPGTYRLGRLAKIMDYLAFGLITANAADGVDYQCVGALFGVVGFLLEFHSLMKLGWNILDYACFEMMFDTLCIIQMFFMMLSAAGRPLSDSYVEIVSGLALFVFFGAMKYFFYLTIYDTIEDRHCIMCDLAMEKYPEKVVELLEGSVLEVLVVSQPKLPSKDDETEKNHS